MVALDAEAMQSIGGLPAPAAGPHGLALGGDWLYCAADGGELIGLHKETGSVRGIVKLHGEPDVIMHDQRLARLYIAVGDP